MQLNPPPALELVSIASPDAYSQPLFSAVLTCVSDVLLPPSFHALSCAHVCTYRVCAVFHEEFHDFGVAIHGGVVEGSDVLKALGVHLRKGEGKEGKGGKVWSVMATTMLTVSKGRGSHHAT